MQLSVPPMFFGGYRIPSLASLSTQKIICILSKEVIIKKAKRIIRVCALLLLTVLLAVPAFATAQPMSSGLGYQTGYVWLNGKRYDATFTLGGSLSQGGCSIFTTDAYCERVHYGVTVSFDTEGAGYQVYTGETYRVMKTKTSTSLYTKYRGGDTPIGIHSISGNLTAWVTNDNGTVVPYEFTASAR